METMPLRPSVRMNCTTEQQSAHSSLNNGGINPLLTLEDIQKKINFGKTSCIISLVFSVVLSVGDRIGDVWSIVNLYFLSSKNGNRSSHFTHFLFSIFLLFVPGIYLSVKSIIIYWNEVNEAGEKTRGTKLFYWLSFRDYKSWWTPMRFIFHFFLMAPAARTIELGFLGSKSNSVFKKRDLTKMRNIFQELKSRDRELTAIQHRQNCFESGPQLWLKIHIMCLHYLSGKDLGLYEILNIFFIMFGIGSCSWKVVCNRKSMNLSNDYERRMSFREHILPRFVGHFSSVGVRFGLFGMLSASSTMGLLIFCFAHQTIVLYLTTFYLSKGGSFFDLSENWGKVWNIVEGNCRIIDVVVSSFFCFKDLGVKKCESFRFMVFHVVPNVEVFVLYVLLAIYCSGMSNILALGLAIVFCFSYALLKVCETCTIRIATIPFTTSPPVVVVTPNDDRRDSPPNVDRPNPTESTHQSAGTSRMRRQRNDNSVSPSRDGSGLPWISSYETTVTNDVHYSTSDHHIRSLFLHIFSSISVRFLLLGVLIIFSRMYFLIFCGFHAFIILSAVTISQPLVQDDILVNKLSKWQEQLGCGKTEGLIKDFNYNHLVNVSLTTLFSVDGHFYKHHHTFFFFSIPFLENLILFIYMCCLSWTSESTVLGFLIVMVILGICISCFFFFWYHIHSMVTLDGKTDDDEENQSSSFRPQSSLISIFLQTLFCIDVPSLKSGLNWYRHNRFERYGHQASIGQIEEAVIIDEVGATSLVRRNLSKSSEENSEVLPVIAAELIKDNGGLYSRNPETTVLMCWCETYQHEDLLDIARMLIESSGFPCEYVNAKNVLEETALHKLCVQYPHENLFSIVKLFLENGADVNAASIQNRTPLLQLCKYYEGDNLIDIVQLLIQKDADVNAADSEGRTPLLELCNNYGKNNMRDVALLLIDLGADVNAGDADGKTPLIELCDPCQPEVKIDVIQLLVDSGVSNDDDVAIQVKKLLEEENTKNLPAKFHDVHRVWNESRGSKAPAVQVRF